MKVKKDGYSLVPLEMFFYQGLVKVEIGLGKGKKFGFQDVVVKQFKSVEEITDCQVIYVSKNISFARNAAKILDKVGKNTLVMTEEEGATNNGCHFSENWFVLYCQRPAYKGH